MQTSPIQTTTVNIPTIHISKSVTNFAKRFLAVGAIVIGALQNANVLGGKYGPVLEGIGAAFLAVDHYVVNN